MIASRKYILNNDSEHSPERTRPQVPASRHAFHHREDFEATMFGDGKRNHTNIECIELKGESTRCKRVRAQRKDRSEALNRYTQLIQIYLMRCGIVACTSLGYDDEIVQYCGLYNCFCFLV